MQIDANMSHKDKDRGGGQEVDVDFDFFDTPRETNTGKKAEKSVGKAVEPSPSTSKSAHTHNTQQQRGGHSGEQSNKSHNNQCSGTSDSDPDSDTDSEIIASKNKTKIAARVPTASNEEDNYDDSFESDDSDNDDDLKNSGRRAPTPMSGRKGRKRTGSSDSDRSENKNVSQKHQAWGEDSLGKHKETNTRPKTGKTQSSHNGRSRSTSRDRQRKRHSSHGSDYSTDTSTDWSSDDSDVTDVSPLHSPHNPSRSGRANGKPPKSPSYKDRGSTSDGQSQSSRLERLLHANRDTMDLNLLMQAVLEMEKQEERSGRPTKPRKRFSVPPPAGPLPQHRRNHSFSNDKTQTIDKENQRLMQQIIKNAVQAKQAKQKMKLKQRTSQPVYHSKVTSATINRQREQQRIEGENRVCI